MLSEARIGRPVATPTRSSPSASVSRRLPMRTRSTASHALPIRPVLSMVSSVATHRPPWPRSPLPVGRTMRTYRSLTRRPGCVTRFSSDGVSGRSFTLGLSAGRSVGVSFLSSSSVTSGTGLWHGTASPLRRRLIDEHDLARGRGLLPVDRYKMGRRRQDLDRERVGRRRRKRRADRQRVTHTVYSDDTDRVSAGALRSGEDRDVEAAVLFCRERTEA